MKNTLTSIVVVFGLADATDGLRAAEPTSRAPSVSAQPKAVAIEPATGALDQHTLDKRINPILKELALGDAAREVRVRAILEPHFQALQAWHARNDAGVAALWSQWADARATAHQDEAKAADIAQQIDRAYASFQPQHDALLAALATALAPGQVDAVKDSLTKSPGLKRTYDAYLQVIPDLTGPQKEFIL